MTTNMEIRTYVTWLYPGSFYPEESGAVRVTCPDTGTVLAAAPDNAWFAAEVTVSWFERFIGQDTGGERWMPRKDMGVTRHRIYVGDVYTVDQIRDLEGDNRILIANVDGHGGRAVRTRCGNWQFLNACDVVISEPTTTEGDNRP